MAPLDIDNSTQFNVSPAINAGNIALLPAGDTTDQRGVPRTKGGGVDIGAVEAGPAVIVVTTLADQNDETIEPALTSAVSLRDALDFANADFYNGDTIIFAAGLEGMLAPTIGPLPAITANMTIAGPGPGVVTIDGQGTAGILSVALART